MLNEKRKLQLSIYQIDMDSFTENGFNEIADTIIQCTNKEDLLQVNMRNSPWQGKLKISE